MEPAFFELCMRIATIAYRSAESRLGHGEWRTAEDIRSEVSGLVEREFYKFANELTEEKEVSSKVIDLRR